MVYSEGELKLIAAQEAESTGKGTVDKEQCSEKKPYTVGKLVYFQLNDRFKRLLIYCIMVIIETYKKTLPKHQRDLAIANPEALRSIYEPRLYTVIYTKGNNNRIESEYSINDDAKNVSLVLRGVVDCLNYIVNVLEDDMFADFVNADICRHIGTIADVEDNTHNGNDIARNRNDAKVKIGDGYYEFTAIHYDVLTSLFPNAENDNERVALAFSALIRFAARIHGKFDLHLSSHGSKNGAMQDNDIKNLMNEINTMYDVFGKTLSIPLRTTPRFERAVCSDTDIRYVNLANVIREYPVAFSLNVYDVMSTGGVLTGRDEHRIENGKKLFIEAKSMVEDDTAEYGKKNLAKGYCKSSKSTRITAAIYLFLWVALSHSGFGTSINSKKILTYDEEKVMGIIFDWIMVSMLLCDEESVKHRKKFEYVKSQRGLVFRHNTNAVKEDTFNVKESDKVDNIANESDKDRKENIVCFPAISYVKNDCIKAIVQNNLDSDDLVPADMPYLRQFGIACGDYGELFTRKKAIDLLTAINESNCKTVVFHSDNLDLLSIAQRIGFKVLKKYQGAGKKGYWTVVLTKDTDTNGNE